MGRTATTLVAAVLAALAAGCSEPTGGRSESQGSDFTLSLVETLGGSDTVGYARALEAYDFTFPDDHGPHEDFRTEFGEDLRGYPITCPVGTVDDDTETIQRKVFGKLLL